MEILIYFAVILIVPLWANMRVKNTYKKYSKVATTANMTGAEVARQILHENGIYDVTVRPGKGFLSDHYNPAKKEIVLSPDNFHGMSVAGAAVAAHEVGHAIQDAEGYAFLRFRSSLAPMANLGSNLSIFLIIGGAILGASGLYLAGIIFFAVAVLFQFVTLPVEFNASSRAMDQMVSIGLIRNEEEPHAKKVLNAAALTYVAAALIALLELLRFILMFAGMNGDD
ncbi:zinc metallopeptidase [Jeotgalibacillus proteolyticus]|uniref:Zn-dependent protease n=1 Tax=Jeotgalibacillus proteolyticus TaxID=2082395 RepID=A0A2S5GE10_9BACL|nr:zinc metallopeptidase [Jeotgalibacillus proteolyticus]PPA71250.1 Zn-dependent protease [Jeotgalibacillus proteolyticus]